jgi:hypothetical protein
MNEISSRPGRRPDDCPEFRRDSRRAAFGGEPAMVRTQAAPIPVSAIAVSTSPSHHATNLGIQMQR